MFGLITLINYNHVDNYLNDFISYTTARPLKIDPKTKHAHTIDTYDYLCYGYFGSQCSTVETSPRYGSKMRGYALEL